MGCCSSENLPGKEGAFECAFVTLRFANEEKNEKGCTPQKNSFLIQEETVQEARTTITESPRSVKSFNTKRYFYKTIELKKDCIISGELMKYHPGISAQFISRFCVLTESEFKYYKSQASKSLCEKPLISIPIDAMEAIRQ